MLADAAVGDDRLGRHPRTPLERRELPGAGAKAGLHARDADLARADADFGGVCAPVLQINHGFRRADIAGNHERVRHFLFDVRNHRFDRIGMAVGDVDGDVVGGDAGSGKRIDGVQVGVLDAERNRDE